MIDYTITEQGDMTYISIPNQGKWGTICFAYDKNNIEIVDAITAQGIDTFVKLLTEDPNTAYSIFINGI